MARGAPLVALADPALPPMDAGHRALFDTLRHSAAAGTGQRPAWFVQPAPLAHGRLFTARLLLDPGVLAATVVDDIAPPDDAASVGIGHATRRLGYALGLYWLARYDLFAATTALGAAGVRTRLAIPTARIALTGLALDPAFIGRRPPGSPPRHVLVSGSGAEDTQCAVRAHAASASLRAAGIGVVLARAHPVADWPVLFRDALCVVAPCRAGGFPLALAHAMAAGVPAIAADTATHRDLVADPTLRFPPGDRAALARILDRLAEAPAVVAAIVAAQAATWPRFRAELVAMRFWSAVQARAEAAADAGARPRPGRAARPRPQVALLSPLPPAPSGVAHYTAATCAALGRIVDLHVFTDTARPDPAPNAASVRPLTAWPLLSGGFDRVVGVVGNALLHARILDLLRRFGGAAIAHDARMLGFYQATRGADGARVLAARELGREVSAEEIAAWSADEATLPTLFLSELAEVAAPLFVHSRATAALVGKRYGRTAVTLPFCVQRAWSDADLAPAIRAAARARLGFAPADTVIASFGFVHDSKAPLACLQALALLRARGVAAALCFVGAAHMDLAPLRAACAALGLAGHVRFVDRFLDERGYRDHLLAADLGVQLRRFGFGSNSGALLDCVAAGLPTVANADLAEALDAPDYVHRIPDTLAPPDVAQGWAALLASGHRRAGAARTGFVAAHDQSIYAKRLCAALGLVTD